MLTFVAIQTMSDDENVLDFGDDAEIEYGALQDGHEMVPGKTFLETFPFIGRCYAWWMEALETTWEFAAVFQPIFKSTWVFAIIYLGITSSKNLSWIQLVPVIGGPVMEEEDDEF